MRIFSIVCSRKDNPPPTLPTLKSYFPEGSLCIRYDESSIFDGYNNGVKELDEKHSLQDDDILIFSHDDIQYLTTYTDLEKILKFAVTQETAGFFGVAGTKILSEDAVWWNHLNWQKGHHRGFIFHGESMFVARPTVYTPPGKELDRRVLVLDGVFLAVQYKVLKALGGWIKPVAFPGTWDFYDIYTTWKANRLGYKNYVLPVILLHMSFGNLSGREGWHANKKEFISLAALPTELV